MTDHHETRPGAVDVDALTVTILTAVERQLTKYLATMSQQVDAVRAMTEQARDDLRAEIAGQAAEAHQAVAAQREANDSYQAALQTALEERLAEFANHQHWRMNDLEDKVAALETRPVGLDQEAEIELRQKVRDDINQLFGPVTSRLDELTNLSRVFDERSSALAHHVNESMAALGQRVDEGDQRLGRAVDERLNDEHAAVQEALTEVARKQLEHNEMLVGKVDAAESRGTDRLLALEARLTEDLGTKIANVEATLGRVGAGFDEALIMLSRRVVELENHLAEANDRVTEMADKLGKIDESAFDDLKAQMSSAIGEAMLVRIELDRVVSTTDEKIDKHAVRLSEIEAQLTDEMDVGAAVQLERLDELERALMELDPDQFVRRGETVGASAATSSGSSGGSPSGFGGGSPYGDPMVDGTGGIPRPAPPSMTLNPRLPGADTNAQHGSAEHGSPTPETDDPSY